jgi:hypothetical protein
MSVAGYMMHKQILEDEIADSAVTTAKIADSAVTTAKIADSAVTTAKIADFKFFAVENSITKVYEPAIQDVYLNTSLLANDFKEFGLWVWNSKLSIAYYGESNAAADLKYLLKGYAVSDIKNGTRIDLTEDDSVVGYIIFRDKAKLLEASSGAPQVINMSVAGYMMHKQILEDEIADSAVTTAKIADSAVTTAKIADFKFFAVENSITKVYEPAIQDVYLNESLLGYEVKSVGLWVWHYDDKRDYVWSVGYYDTDDVLHYLAKGKSLAELVLYEKNMLSEDGVNVGYIIFRDKETLKLKTTGTPQVFNRNIVSNIAWHSYLRSDVGNNEEVSITLPDKIYAIVGDTLQLFYRGMIHAVNPYNYDIKVNCLKGQQFPRYFEFTPDVNDIGETSIEFVIRDDLRNIIASKSCTLVVRDVVKSPEKELKVACFGASTTYAGTWCIEAYRRLALTGGTPEGNGLSNISFIGRKKVGGVGFCGEGGWSWEDYTTEGRQAYRFYVSGATSITTGATYTNNGNTFTVIEVNMTQGVGSILCTRSDYRIEPESSGELVKASGGGDSTIAFSSSEKDSANPLWDSENGKMTFIPYANNYGDGSIDVVYVMLGGNGLSTPAQTDFSDFFEQMEVFADTLHEEFPDAILKIMTGGVPSVRGGIGSNYGASGMWSDGYGAAISILNMSDAYQSFANRDEYKDFVEFVGVACQFDSEYGYPNIDKAVNTRSDVTEWLDTNALHPSKVGYMQIADAVYRNFVASFCQ